jgi:hypothetical protein
METRGAEKMRQSNALRSPPLASPRDFAQHACRDANAGEAGGARARRAKRLLDPMRVPLSQLVGLRVRFEGVAAERIRRAESPCGLWAHRLRVGPEAHGVRRTPGPRPAKDGV